MVKGMDMVSFNIMMDHIIRDNGERTKCMGKGILQFLWDLTLIFLELIGVLDIILGGLLDLLDYLD